MYDNRQQLYPLTRQLQPVHPSHHLARTMKKSIVVLGAVVVEIAMAIILVSWTDHGHIETTDLVDFYAAATIERLGEGPSLYRAETQDPVLKSIQGRKVTGYFLHPPFEAVKLARQLKSDILLLDLAEWQYLGQSVKYPLQTRLFCCCQCLLR
jgi:hypothetical protein